ncbi:MAG: D-glycero-beta-D-manno-heptose 1-phosphate adenylyltransferase [Gammaproteobacteria bacterium]|nr:D-glycero-beta-D-manno-heptose 1-phosphate adenylyltransferase [Gammaproteobacteria bacterium]
MRHNGNRFRVSSSDCFCAFPVRWFARFDQGTRNAAASTAETLLLERLRDVLTESDALIVSDYGCGSITTGVIAMLAASAPKRTIPLMADGRDLERTGGGDTFVAAFTLALAAGTDTPEAAELAAAAAAVVATKDRTAACTAHELHEAIADSEKRIADVNELRERVSSTRARGQRLVFTNGCFDILHRGHVTLLNRAKALGDVLIVGVNSDDSVHRFKGRNRSINALDDRLKVLAALSYVDYVVAVDADSPRELIRAVQPDIYVKGGDYTRETLPEAPLIESLGGAVCILPYLEERSTTGIIARIRGVV